MAELNNRPLDPILIHVGEAWDGMAWLYTRDSQAVRLETLVQQVLSEGLEQGLVVLRSTLGQRSRNSGDAGILDDGVDVRVAHMALEFISVELQAHHGQILDVHAEQKDAGAALDDVGFAPVATLHLALVERLIEITGNG